MTGLLNQKNVANVPFLFGMIIVMYVGHGGFHPIEVIFFDKSVLEEVLSSQIEG